MSLRRFQPISRFGQWRESVSFPDPQSDQFADLAAATISLGLYRVDGPGWRCDYGRSPGVWGGGGYGVPALSAATNADNTGPLRKVRGGLAVQWIFPQSVTAGLRPGPHLMILAVAIRDQVDEALRETVQVLDGPAPGFGGLTFVAPTPVLPPPPPVRPPVATAIRTITGADPAAILPTDGIVLLDGPALAILPAAPTNGFAVLLKDAGSVEANQTITITAADGATIDGLRSLIFTTPDQAATLTFVTSRGWIIT